MSHFVALASLKLNQKMYLPPSAGIEGVHNQLKLLLEKMIGTGSHELGASVF